ncbi:MAG TPA: hypothetical protein VMJ10_04030 [Kofleriaceae bacterium]|nr:hypothetical protein [Kofleriaceae bacterium]
MTVDAMIVVHPWRAVAVGFAIGAMLALGERSRSRLVRTASGALGDWMVDSVRRSLDPMFGPA